MVSAATAAAAAALVPTSVTCERKEALLQQARGDRLQWIRKVPLPYQPPPPPPQQQQHDDNNSNDADSNTKCSSSWWWHQDERLRQLKNSHAVQQLPTALMVLSHLYGIPNHNNDQEDEAVQEIGERVASIIAKTAAATDDDDDDYSNDNGVPAVPRAEKEVELLQQLQASGTTTLDNKGGDSSSGKGRSGNDDPDDLLLAYHAFVTHLADPVCAMLVQGMRSFCRNLKTTSMTASSSSSSSKDQVARNLQAYLDSTMESMQQQHAAWMQHQQLLQQSHNIAPTIVKSPTESSLFVRRSLDSFIYGQCHEFIMKSLYWDEAAKTKEREWLDRIDSLQFVNPRHLEIAGLEIDDNNNDSYIQQLLQEPIHALRSVHRYHAPFEKLQRILAVYRGVNAALSMAMNNQNQDDNNGNKQQQQQQPKRLPSADDVLPTIILTVLKARPERLLVNLQLVEDFLPASHLRAEAGYALTTLHGAVSFIQDLNLDNDEPQSLLAMGAQEFRQGLAACRKAMEDKLAAAAAAATAAVTLRSDPLAADIDVVPSEVYSIPVQEVRAARLRGEVVDMDWAMRWQAKQQPQQEQQVDAEAPAVSSSKHTPPTPSRTVNNSVLVDELTEGLPIGFTRNYTFLATRPDDIRMADLPRLLSEYRMLVHATESLLAERMAKHAAERKAHRMQRQKELYARARQLDPSLLPSSSSSNHYHNNNGGCTPKKPDDRSRDFS
jgi:Vacuolar sorting protein 9 (VPS9) domain